MAKGVIFIFLNCNFVYERVVDRYPFYNLQINKRDPKPYFEEKEKKSQRAPLLSNFKTKCINSDISISLVPLGVNWVSKEVENIKEL